MKSIPCRLFEQDIHREQNYDLVSNRIHFQIYLFFLIVPLDGQLFSSWTVQSTDRSTIIKSADPIPFRLHTIYWCSNSRLQIHQNILEQIRLDDQHRLHLAECPLVSKSQFIIGSAGLKKYKVKDIDEP